MENIPITFDQEGKQYTGTFTEVAGSGASKTWHLVVDNFYFGRLRWGTSGWVFDPTPKTASLAQLADYFGNYITLWYS